MSKLEIAKFNISTLKSSKWNVSTLSIANLKVSKLKKSQLEMSTLKIRNLKIPSTLNMPTPTPAPDHLLGGHKELGGTSVERRDTINRLIIN